MWTSNKFRNEFVAIICLLFVVVDNQLTTTWTDRPELRMGKFIFNFRPDKHLRRRVHSFGHDFSNGRDIQNTLCVYDNIDWTRSSSWGGLVRIRKLFALPDKSQRGDNGCS